MKKRLFWLTTLLVILSLVLVACGGDEEPVAEQGGAVDEALEEREADESIELEEEEVPEEAEPMEAAELTLMGWSSSEAENTRLQSIVDDFNATSDLNASLNLVPDYDTKLQTSLAGGAPPDVFYVDSFRLPDLVAAGALEPAEGRLEAADDFYPSLREAFTYDGTFYCPPKDFSTLALQYLGRPGSGRRGANRRGCWGRGPLPDTGLRPLYCLPLPGRRGSYEPRFHGNPD